MSTAETETELELIQALDFDPDVACEAFHGTCGKAAQWYRLLDTCNCSVWSCCEQHRQVFKHHVAESSAMVGDDHKGSQCRRCRAVFGIADVRFEPVKAGGK